MEPGQDTRVPEKVFYEGVRIEVKRRGWFLHGFNPDEGECVIFITNDQLKTMGFARSGTAKNASMEKAKQAVKDGASRLVTDFLGE